EEENVRSMGVFDYYFGDEHLHPLDPYVRTLVPDVPLHIDQLPPALRQQLRQVTFTLRFEDARCIQPIELGWECVMSNNGAEASLCPHGFPVRPMPGHEPCLAGFVREFRQKWPAEAERLVFDEPALQACGAGPMTDEELRLIEAVRAD